MSEEQQINNQEVEQINNPEVEEPQKKKRVKKEYVETTMKESYIPSSRVKSQLCDNILNKSINEVIEELKKFDLTKEKLDYDKYLTDDSWKKDFVDAMKEKKKDDVELSDEEQRGILITLFSKEKFKFNGMVFAAIALFYDEIVKEIVQNSINDTSISPDGILKLDNSEKNLTFYPVYSTLKAFKMPTERVKQNGYSIYVDKVCRDYKGLTKETSTLKVNGMFKDFCNGLLMELTEKFAKLINILTERCSKTQSVNEKMTFAIIEIMMLPTGDTSTVNKIEETIKKLRDEKKKEKEDKKKEE